MDECELISLVTAAACGISKCYNDQEISIMSAVFSQLGDTLATVLTLRELNETNNNEKIGNNQDNDNNTNINFDNQANINNNTTPSCSHQEAAVTDATDPEDTRPI